MSRLVMARPQPKQIEALRARTKYVAFGGARGGGKSWFVRCKAVLLAQRWPGIRLLIVRRTLDELRRNHVETLTAQLVPGFARYNKQEKQFRFRNGSTIDLAYCDGDADLPHFQGAEWDVIFLDEATQLSELQMETIKACLRGVNDFPHHIYYTCNPGGQGHGYIKRLFIDRQYKAEEEPEDYTFVQSFVTDNQALMRKNPDYVRQLRALPPKLRKAWLEGVWDIFEGMFFEDFRPEPDVKLCHDHGMTPEEARSRRLWTHVIEPFDPPRDWNIMRSYDFGYNKPYSMAYWAVDYDGVLYRIAEVYGCGETPNEGVRETPEEQAARFVQFEREHPYLAGRRIVDSVADPSIWDASRGESIAETMARHGIYFTPGDNKRIPGWMQVHYRLQFDENGRARMYVFRNCRAFLRTMPLLEYADRHPEDLDTDGEDHVADEVRYMCMSRPVRPIRAAVPKPIYSDPLDQFGGSEDHRRKIWTR